jgi:hypothetical protein
VKSGEMDDNGNPWRWPVTEEQRIGSRGAKSGKMA